MIKTRNRYVIASAGITLHLMIGGVYAWSVFTGPIVKQTGWAETSVSFAFSLASEIERQLISERTRLSLQRLKDEGKHLGRPYGTSYQKLQKEHDRIKRLVEKGLTKAEIARSLSCSWLTIHRYIQRNFK